MASPAGISGSDIVICSPLRTPVGRMGGAFSKLTVNTLATDLLRELASRTGLGEHDIDDVILGQGYANGESPALGRIAALDAGLGVGVPGTQIDRRCGSGLQAILSGAAHVASGGADLVVAGGAESMSNVEHYALGLRTGVGQGAVELRDRLDRGRLTAGGDSHPVPGGMIETAENLRAKYGLTREAQDRLSAESHRRALDAIAAGRFADEIVPVTVPGGRKSPDVVVDTDEHPRPGTTVESLGRLRAIRSKIDPDSTVTAGNASGQNDGAAMVVVTTLAEAERRGLDPVLALRSWAVTGCEPAQMGIGPVSATAKALDRAGLTLDDLDLIELNEAFAAQVLAVLAEWRIDADDPRLNPNGSGISLGHPIGATGARLVVTAAHEARRRQAANVLVTMCIGGGQGLAGVFQAVR
ncbi:acetyl-CoA C-acetyltransferase [Gordonia hydrophobica]|uniref:Probable acetyl-CoA acetyltransferase n=1 Tax=Gordonia hydrophobica TaxID=40516 RepID=A0ABZ2U4F4_9ACTN|nr:acetyl-CoA C-acetyltransferase [Gordonia hydrophobica]MBM7368297.1 acetyl-CoA C-acetyltransferase [Gordonia hydrophobica]